MTDNEALKKKFEESKNEQWGCNTINPKYCKTCIFSHGQPPFEDAPEKSCCMIYSNERGLTKPDNVYYEGGLCEYHNNGDEEPQE